MVTHCHLLGLLEFPVLGFATFFFLGVETFRFTGFLDWAAVFDFGDEAATLPEFLLDFSSGSSFGSGVSMATNPMRRSKYEIPNKMTSGIKQRKMNSKTTKNEGADGSFIAFPPRQSLPTAYSICDWH
jgi:hypothetical protein